jgi:peptidoglycan/LPS O-acetylase OafA/YrhL
MLMALGWRSPSVRAWLAARGGALYAAPIVFGAGMVGLWTFAPHAIDRTMQTIGFTWVALFYGVIMLLALLRRDGPIARVMRVGWLRELGKVSYCMYIIHLVVDLVCHYLLLHEIPRISTARGLAVSVLAIFVTYGLAKISWAVLEQPMLRRGHQFEY